MFDDTTSEPRDVRAYCALARVDDDDPIQVHTVDGKVLGTAVSCRIVDGPFVGAEVSAVLCAPLGQSTPNLPGPGDTIVLMLPHGHLDGPILATHTMPGGAKKPMPAAVAGIDVSNVETLSKTQINAPPKGVGVRQYLRGAPFVIRLKGAQDDFVGEFYLDFDDGASLHGRWDPQSKSIAFKMRDKKGAFLQVKDGELSLQSPNAENGVYVTDEGVKIIGRAITVNGSESVLVDGGFVGLGLGPTLPAPGVNNALVGTATPGGPPAAPLPATGFMSGRVFIGIILCPRYLSPSKRLAARRRSRSLCRFRFRRCQRSPRPASRPSSPPESRSPCPIAAPSSTRGRRPSRPKTQCPNGRVSTVTSANDDGGTSAPAP